MRTLSGLVLLGMCLPAAIVSATEVRVLRVYVPFELITAPPCVAKTGWASTTVFHNTTDAQQTVQFLGVSNGTARPQARPLVLAPHKTFVVRSSDQLLNWQPTVPTLLWVTRLDAPAGVIVANRLEAAIFQPFSADPSHWPCTGVEVDYAGLPLPVASSLVAAGVQQYFLGTDVGGGNQLEVADSRINIGVYNGGAASANVQVQVYCSSLSGPAGGPADFPLKSDQFDVPPNAVVQKTVLASTSTSQCPVSGDALWHAAVTVDQPSFAYAIGMANGTLPTFPGVVAPPYTGN